MIPNFEIRARARKALKPVMQVMIVIALVAALPGLLSETVMLLTKSSPSVAFTPVLNSLLDLYEELPELNVLEVTIREHQLVKEAETALNAYLASPEIIIWGAATLAASVLSPALLLGLYRALICAVRGEEVAFAMAWPGMKRFFKGVGVNWLTGLLVFLWMLPGMLLASVSLVLLPQSAASAGYTLGLGLAMYMSIRAVFSYSMAPFILADKPETGLRAALRRSKQAMRGRRMLLFSLEVSFLIWMMGVSLLQSTLQVMAGAVIALTLGQFARLFLDVYMSGSMAVFYELYTVNGLQGGMTVPETEEEIDRLNDEE